ncbi:MAG: ATPase [Sedimenticola sp.]|nr:MAG: ATPase [Sedimenticola sp.]
MIITSISAQNVLKYAELEITDLPAQGLIAIDGANESGKSTIGETICFALFGRSFSLNADELQKLIRWGENRCSASLRFRVDDEQEYEIARFLDRDGNHGVRLNLVGQGEQPLAKGTEAVENAVYELLGYGYDEFIESFYLAQREITTPHPHSYAVKTMAGISSLEYVAYEYEEEIESEQESIEELKYEIGTIQQELDELEINTQDLPNLEQDKSQRVAAEEKLNVEVVDLEQASVDYQDAVPKIRSAKGARGRAKFFRFIFLLLALATGAAWGLLTRMPEHAYSEKLQTLITQYLPQWSAQHIPWLMYAAIGSALLFLLLWIRAGSLNGRIRKLQEAADNLSRKLTELQQAVPEQIDSEAEAPLTAMTEEASEVQAGESEDTPSFVATRDATEPRPDSQEISAMSRRIALCEAEPAEVRDAVGRELAWMRRELQQHQESIVRFDQQIWRERDRLSKAEKLAQTIASLSERVDEHEHRVYLRELARELLAGATRHLSQRFNRDLRDLVGRTLPMFTEERYEHLQIDDDLTVRVFSSEKRDFMDLEEISSGTQRQIMLAVRLALSQELVNSTVQSKQFIFLDEPFAFFDRERTLSALKVLPELSDDITQIWIVAQEFPDAHPFDRTIHCTRDQQAMVLAAHRDIDTQAPAETGADG